MAEQKPTLSPELKKLAERWAKRSRKAAPVLDQAQFQEVIRIERKRSDRSGRPFALALFRPDVWSDQLRIQRIRHAFLEEARETDLIGWYEEGRTIGFLFSELGEFPPETPETLRKKAGRILEASESFTFGEKKLLRVTLYLYPQNQNFGAAGEGVELLLFPDLTQEQQKRKSFLRLKRTLDILGSAGLLIVLSPLLLLIALLIKATSRGPVLFRQQRVGQYGRPFSFLKFRSMYSDVDHRVHEQFIDQFINGTNGDKTATISQSGLYKLTDDARVTPLGRLLRKSSLDELPQLFHVLVGDLSLVGPRPPLEYELKRYDPWHLSRILEAKPGVTGLWQVWGRSRTSFDEMVRLDLHYARNWSLRFDLLILLQTPWAVIKGDGAC